VIVAARAQSRVATAGERAADGSIRFSQLPFTTFWAITVSREDLLRTARGDELPATAVIYHRFDAGSPTQYRDRLAEISRDTSVPDFADRLRESVRASRADAAAAPPPRPSAPPPRPRPDIADPADTAPPPPPGRAAGAGAAPPPRPGFVPPPPRPGSTPPPRG
jgi:hypothetical protein